MSSIRSFALAALFLGVPLAYAKTKDKPTLPPYILNARTVAVIIEPGAGTAIEDPRANQVAQRDVEAALSNWGRFMPVLAQEQADLIIVVRRGSGKVASPTIYDPRQNNRPGSITPGDDGISIGAQHGTPNGSQPGPASGIPTSQLPGRGVEIGNVDDSFQVYEGSRSNPLGNVPGWRYIAADALHPHNVPAVEKFRKAIDEAEKAAARQAQQKQSTQQSTQPAPSHP